MSSTNHPLVVAATERYAREVRRWREAGNSGSTEPGVTAIVDIFMGKLLGRSPAEEVPLEQIVSRQELARWQAVFDDPEELRRVRHLCRFHGLFSPPVYPQEDGSIGVALPWVHPEQTERRDTPAGESMSVLWAYVVLDVEPDGWRVRKLT